MTEDQLSAQKPSRSLQLLGRGICPDCTVELEGDYCPECQRRYWIVGGGE